MFVEQSKTPEKVGMVLGYLLSYLIFTTILFLVLYFLKKIPESWSIVNVGYITAGIALAAYGVRKYLQ